MSGDRSQSSVSSSGSLLFISLHLGGDVECRFACLLVSVVVGAGDGCGGGGSGSGRAASGV